MDEILATYEMGRVAYVNRESRTVGVVTRLGERKVVLDQVGFAKDDEVVIVDRRGFRPFLASLSDWYEIGTLEFFGAGPKGEDDEA